jgi:hypothetical protein
MAGIVVQVGTAHLNTTGVGFMTYANHYYEAANRVGVNVSDRQFDPVPYQLYCQSLELRLKSFLWLSEPTLTRQQIRGRYGHDLAKLWRDAKARGIAKFIRITTLRERVISLVSPYYKNRRFCYVDLDMMFTGYQELKGEPQSIPTLKRLIQTMGRSLRKPILDAS